MTGRSLSFFVCTLIPHQRRASLAKYGHSLLISTICLASQTTSLLSSAHTADADLPPPLMTKCAMQTVERIPRRNLKQCSTPHMRIKHTWRKLRYHLTWYQDNLPMQCCGRTFGNPRIREHVRQAVTALGNYFTRVPSCTRPHLRTYQASKRHHDTLGTCNCTPEGESGRRHRNRRVVVVESTSHGMVYLNKHTAKVLRIRTNKTLLYTSENFIHMQSVLSTTTRRISLTVQH